jgi:hypothetical protein
MSSQHLSIAVPVDLLGAGVVARRHFAWPVPCRWLLTLVASLLNLVPLTDAHAEIIRLKLTGTIVVGDSHGILPDDIVTGEEFVAFWSYDTSIADTLPDLPYAGSYVHPLADPFTSEYGLSVRINDHVFYLDTLGAPYTVNVIVGRFAPPDLIVGGDRIDIQQSDVVVPFEYDSPTSIEDRIDLFFSDSFFSTPADSSLPSDALPEIVDPSDFASARVRIDGFGSVSVGGSPPPSFNIEALIDNISVVPEPSTDYLVLTFATLLGWRRRSSC